MDTVEVLLIEDNPGDVELTRESFDFDQAAGSVHVVMDGEEALDYLYQRGSYIGQRLPDIVLLDLNLPKVSGLEILKTLKQDSERCTIPIIILSSSEASRDIRESYLLHANCFVTKPVELADFINVMAMIKSFWIDTVRLPQASGDKN